MPTIGSITKTIRINPADLKVIERIMADGTSWSGAIHRLCSENGSSAGTPVENPYKLDTEILKDLDTMARFGGGSVGEIIRMLDEGLNNGSLILGANRIEGKPPINLDRFLERCREVGADPQKVLDKATGGLR